MQVEAIYNRGKLEFPKTIRLAHQRFSVQVILPDDVIETKKGTEAMKPLESEEKVQPHIQGMLDDLNTILNAYLSPDDDLPELTEKQQERIEAFELRRKFRQEQGRPA